VGSSAVACSLHLRDYSSSAQHVAGTSRKKNIQKLIRNVFLEENLVMIAFRINFIYIYIYTFCLRGTLLINLRINSVKLL